MKKFVNFLTLAILVVGLAAVGYAQKTDLSGTWIGFAERQGNADDLTVVLEKKGDIYTGKLTDQMGMFPGVEIKKFSVKDDVVTFEFDGAMGGQTFTIKAELKLSADGLKGNWTMAGSDDSGAFELKPKK